MKRTKRILITTAAGLSVAGAAYLAMDQRIASQQSVIPVPKKERSSAQMPVLTTLAPSDLPAVCEADPVLQSAITKWCDAARTGGSLSESDQAVLHSAIVSSTLDPASLLAIADCIKRYAKTETLVAGLLAQRASEVVLAEPRSDDPAQFARRVKLLMDIKRHFWFVMDKGERQFTQQQLIVCDDLASLQPGMSPDFEEARISSVIGAAECLYLMNRNEESLARLDQLTNDTQLTPKHRVSVAWARALPLFALDRYAEAIPYFEQAANVDGYDHQPDATCMLALSHLRSGNRQDVTPLVRMIEERFPDARFTTLVRIERQITMRNTQ